MGYIQIEIGGKLRGLKFNNYAVHEFLKTLDVERFNLTANDAMFWGGLCGNCYVKREELDFTFEDVVDWVEKLDKETIDKVSMVMAETEAYKKLLPEDKKKVTKKKSQPVST